MVDGFAPLAQDGRDLIARLIPTKAGCAPASSIAIVALY
jgi:hypothetical protein